jgi:nucleoside-diphosphate-sugar epimerase
MQPLPSTDTTAMNLQRKGAILITGASGLLGQELLCQLSALKRPILALYNRSPVDTNGNDYMKSMQVDLLDVVALEDCMQGVEEVYHCAGLVSFSSRRKKRLYQVNVEGTANLVNAALLCGVKKIVHVSSVAALGRLREHVPITEMMQWTEETSRSVYAHSKYLGEMEMWRGMGEGLKVVVVNPSIILGAGNWDEGSTGIFKSAYESFPWYAEGTTGFVDVRDVASVMIQLMQSDVSNERFIISAENQPYRTVFNLIAKAFGKKFPHKKVTPFIASLIWRFEHIKSWFTGTEPLLTKETAANALAHVQYDNTKLKRFLPHFQYHPIADTISHTCMALQQKLNKH